MTFARRLLAIALAVACAACSKPQSSGTGSRHPWTVPGVLRIGVPEEPDSLNLMFGHTWATDSITPLLFSFLMRVDANGNYFPDLATVVPTLANGGIARDGKTITIHLRKGVVWSDGAPLNAADWMFTYRSVMNPQNNVKTRYGWDLIASASSPDPYTIVLHLKRPSVEVLGILSMGGAAYPPMPAHLLAKYANINSSGFNDKPISSGPYLLKAWSHGSSLEFVPNPRYFRGAPKLKEVIWKVVPDTNTLFNQLAAHEIDVYPAVTPPSAIARLASIEGVTIEKRLVGNWRHLDMNTSHPLLADVRVRRAISEAVNWKRINDTIYRGYDRLAVSDIFPQLWAAPKLPPYRYDPQDARKLLADAGWKMGSDGVLHKGPLAMHLTIYATTGHEENTQSQVMMQSFLHPLGIDLTVRNFPGSYLFAQNGPLYTGKYDLEWSVDTNGPDPDNTGNWSAAYIPPNGANTTWLDDPIVNATSEAAASTFDPAKRKVLYQREEERIRELVPTVFFSWQTSFTAISTDVKNYEPAAFLADTWNAWQWSI